MPAPHTWAGLFLRRNEVLDQADPAVRLLGLVTFLHVAAKVHPMVHYTRPGSPLIPGLSVIIGQPEAPQKRRWAEQLAFSSTTSPKPTSGPPGSTSGLPIIRAIAEYLPESDIPTTSPWDGFVSPARERTSRTIRAEQRNAHHLARAIFDRGRALISVEVRLSEARGH